MRIKDLLETKNEADLPPSSREAMPASMIVPDLDPNYEFYRMVVALAGLPENDDIPLNSVLKDSPMVIPYSKIEHDLVLKILAKMKKTPTHLSKGPSGEMDTVHKISPVRSYTEYD